MRNSQDNPNQDVFVKPMYSAIAEGDINSVRHLIDEGADVNYYNYLANAIQSKDWDLDIIRTLLENGAQPNEWDEEGYSPLACAIIEGRIEAVKILLDHGADIRQYGTTLGGYTLLMEAVIAGQTLIFKYLIGRGANPRQKSHDEGNLYDWAKRNNIDLTPYFS